MAVKETRKLAKEEPSDIASEVLDDGYIDVMDDKTVALFPLGDMIIPTGIDYKPGDPEEDALAVTDALPEIEDLCFLEVPKFFSLKGSVVTPAMMLELFPSRPKGFDSPGSLRRCRYSACGQY